MQMTCKLNFGIVPVRFSKELYRRVLKRDFLITVSNKCLKNVHIEVHYGHVHKSNFVSEKEKLLGTSFCSLTIDIFLLNSRRYLFLFPE